MNTLENAILAVVLILVCYQGIGILISMIPPAAQWIVPREVRPFIFVKVHDKIRVRHTAKKLGQRIWTVIVCLITILAISWHGESDPNIGSDPMEPNHEIQSDGAKPTDPIRWSQTKGSNPMEPNDGLSKWGTIPTDEWNAHFTDFQIEDSGARIVNDTDPIRDDLIRCFSPFYDNSSIGFTKFDHEVTCDIPDIGHFRVKCGSKICRVMSLDDDNEGTEYMMKQNTAFRTGESSYFGEFQVMDFLSRNEQSRQSTATLHPRFPYLSWAMPNGKWGGWITLIVSQRLIGRNLNNGDVDHPEPWYETEDSLMSFAVHCMDDIQNVREVLWRFKNAHFVHNDVHTANVIVTNDTEADRYRCNVIDFGKMYSIDHEKGACLAHHLESSPLWHKVLAQTSFVWMPDVNVTKRARYIEQYGIENLRERGWRWKSMEWTNMVAVDPLRQLLHQTEGGWPESVKCSTLRCRNDTMEIFEEMWCAKKMTVKRLVDRMLQRQRKDGTLKNQAFFNLMRAHLSNIERDMKEADIECKARKLAEEKAPGKTGKKKRKGQANDDQ